MTMRVLAMLTLIVSATAAPVCAETWTIGARGGAAYTSVRFEDASATDARWMPVAGVFVTLPPRWGVALQPEVLYAPRGAVLTGSFEGTSIRIDVLDVPVLGRVSLGRRLYVVAGPSFGVRLRAHTRTTFGGVTEEFDVSSQLRRVDVGVTGGAGIQFRALVIDARYTFGLTDIDRDTTDEATTHTRALSFTAGWRF